MGRPSEYSPTILPLVQCAATFGATSAEIADYLGIPTRSFDRWAATHPELWRALKLGREQADERMERSLYRAGIEGNVTAMIFWLKNRRPSDWRDVQNIQGDVGHYILSDKPMTEEQWIAERTKVIDAKPVSGPLVEPTPDEP